ncbi:MAG: transporter substrate-binding domain-containing protein [Cetobacterium sp.]
MSKKNVDLLEKINKALEEIKADGTYDSLLKKHM